MKTIRQLRQERDWSQLDLAVRLGASVGAVYKWERGVAVPHPKHQQRLAALFGVSVDDIRAALTTVPDCQSKKTIRQLREERGWTQVRLAVRLGVRSETVSDWERGVTMPRPGMQQGLAHLFGVNVTDIAFGPAEPAPQDRPQSRHNGPGGEVAPGPSCWSRACHAGHEETS